MIDSYTEDVRTRFMCKSQSSSFDGAGRGDKHQKLWSLEEVLSVLLSTKKKRLDRGRTAGRRR